MMTSIGELNVRKIVSRVKMTAAISTFFLPVKITYSLPALNSGSWYATEKEIQRLGGENKKTRNLLHTKGLLHRERFDELKFESYRSR